MAVPGFEPGSIGPQPIILTTRLYHLFTVVNRISIIKFLQEESNITKKGQKSPDSAGI